MTKSHLKLAAVFVGLAIAIPLIVLLFTAPASKGAPHNLPIGVVGQGPAVAQVSSQLESRQPGGFDVRSYGSADELIAATKNRDVYGGVVLAPQPQAITATGASPVVAPIITQLANAAAQGTPVRVVDVAPPSAGDPRGAGFGSMVLPVFLSGMVLALSTVFIGGHPKVVAIALPIGAAIIGAAAVGAAMSIGVLPGGFWAQWLAMTAGMLAIGATVAGLVSLFGIRGVSPAALLFMLIGMPLAGVAAPHEFLPQVWSVLGQSLPIGATGTALRSAAFFAPDSMVGAGAGGALLVLAVWIVVGYALLAVGAVRRRGEEREDLLSDDDEVTPSAAAVA